MAVTASPDLDDRASTPVSGPESAMLVAAVVLTFAALVFATKAFYLPGIAPNDFKKDDSVEVHVNTLQSEMSALPYDFYFDRFKFCTPKEGVRYDGESLGSILWGDRLKNSAFKVSFLRRSSWCFDLSFPCSKMNRASCYVILSWAHRIPCLWWIESRRNMSTIGIRLFEFELYSRYSHPPLPNVLICSQFLEYFHFFLPLIYYLMLIMTHRRFHHHISILVHFSNSLKGKWTVCRPAWSIPYLKRASSSTSPDFHWDMWRWVFCLTRLIQTLKDKTAYLNTHFIFTIQYHEYDEGKYRVVGVFVMPSRWGVFHA